MLSTVSRFITIFFCHHYHHQHFLIGIFPTTFSIKIEKVMRKKKRNLLPKMMQNLENKEVFYNQFSIISHPVQMFAFLRCYTDFQKYPIVRSISCQSLRKKCIPILRNSTAMILSIENSYIITNQKAIKG